MKEEPVTYRITDLELDERPRERLARLGPQSLSTAELLAILLRVGIEGENAVQVGQHLMQHFGGLHGLHSASVDDICRVRGVGLAKATQIKAALELGKRLLVEEPSARPVIHSPEDAANLVRYEMSALQQEHLRVMQLDTRNRVLGIDSLYVGSLNSSPVRVGELFRLAIQRNSAGVILVHNHPSGDPSPSPEDIQLTRAACQAGKLMDIQVLDHLVIGHGRYVSLKERHLGFE